MNEFQALERPCRRKFIFNACNEARKYASLILQLKVKDFNFFRFTEETIIFKGGRHKIKDAPQVTEIRERGVKSEKVVVSYLGHCL